MSETLEFAGVKAKPCPFCGGDDLMFDDFILRGAGFLRVHCRNWNCETYGPADLGKSGAIDKWNDANMREVDVKVHDLGDYYKEDKE